jgi:hypothetical protein
MSEETVGCKTMSQEDFLQMIEDHPMLKEKLEEIGINHDDEGLNVALNYSDLLTEKEKKILKKRFKKFGFDPKKDADKYFLKFNTKKRGFICFSDVVCDSCYKGLLGYREEKAAKKLKKKQK